MHGTCRRQSNNNSFVMNPSSETLPSVASGAVLAPSDSLPEDSIIVRGHDFASEHVDYNALLSSFLSTGFQATHFAEAVSIIHGMVRSNLPSNSFYSSLSHTHSLSFVHSVSCQTILLTLTLTLTFCTYLLLSMHHSSTGGLRKSR